MCMYFFAIVLFYLAKVYSVGNGFYDDDNSSFINVAISDSLIVSVCMIFYISSSFFVGFKSFVLRFFSVFVFMFYLLDFFILLMFNSRLYISDIRRFIFNIDFGLFNNISFSIISILFFILFYFVFKPVSKYKINKSILVLFILVIISSSGYTVDSSVRSNFFKNYIDINIQSTYQNEYTNKQITHDIISENKKCAIFDQGRPKKIIIFLFESWSYYHSALFGNGNNWTPELDSLAKNNINFKYFYANGFTTEMGLYSLLMGKPFIPYKSKYGNDGSFGVEFKKDKISLVSMISQFGYKTTFLTSGDLGFLSKGKWLESLSFDNVYGSKEFNEKNRKYLFDSVSDHELYKKVKSILNSEDNQFLVVENVNTHQPFYYPDGDVIKKSEEGAFRYGDKELSQLVKNLISDDIMIFVMSDHRAMTKVTNKEIHDSGRMAVSRVPMFLIWNGKRNTILKSFQQSDVLPSLIGFLSGQNCNQQFQGSIFPIDEQVASECIYHARGDNRSLVSVECSKEQFDVLLDGDDTRVLNSDKKKPSVINYIESVRLSN